MVDVPRDVEAERLAEIPFNASDPEQVNAARKKAARLERSRLRLVEELMKVKEGRMYVWDFLESCHINGNPVVPGDTQATYFNLGQQNVGKLVLMDAMQFPENYVLMVSEAKVRK